MIKILLFDLSGTLEADGSVRAGVPQALTALQQLVTEDGAALTMCLVSDFRMPIPRTPQAIDTAFKEFLVILDRLELTRFFQPVEQCVTLSTHAGVTEPARAFFETTLRRAGGGYSFPACLFITASSEHIRTCRELGMTTLQFGVDFPDWREAPALIAHLIDPRNPHNLQAVLRPVFRLRHDARLESIDSIKDGIARGKARIWVPLESPDLHSLKGVRVELPIQVDARLDSEGRINDTGVAAPSKEDVDSATEQVLTLRSNDQIAGDSNVRSDSSPVLPTHSLEIDDKGRRLLVRRRFTSM
jgi:hypothetical protein